MHLCFYIFQTFLRHPECRSARQSRDDVFAQMRKALDVIDQVLISDGAEKGGDISPTTATNGDSGISLAQPQATAFRAIKEFEVRSWGFLTKSVTKVDQL